MFTIGHWWKFCKVLVALPCLWGCNRLTWEYHLFVRPCLLHTVIPFSLLGLTAWCILYYDLWKLLVLTQIRPLAGSLSAGLCLRVDLGLVFGSTETPDLTPFVLAFLV
jgi:hypothetical protein